MNNTDKAYIELCKHILENGNKKGDRTGTGTISDFGKQLVFDLSEGFPLLTTKKVHFKSVVGELLFFLSGGTNIKFLQDNDIKIWDAWATEKGEIGPMYGTQWRDWGGQHDQIESLVFGLTTNPNSRRHLVSAWNVANLPNEYQSPYINALNSKMALAPCHYSFQCYVNDGKLSMMVNQRSADIFLGVPFNIASYALFAHMLAQVCGLEVGKLIWSGGDCHIYLNHIEQVKKQIARFDNNEVYDLPQLMLNPAINDIDNFTFNDIKLNGYQSGTTIKGGVAV